MKNLIKSLSILLIILCALPSRAQENIWDRSLPNFRYPDKRGINEFEPKKDTIEYNNEVKVRIGGASTIQFQALDHNNSANSVPPRLHDLGNNFNLPTANLDLDVLLYDGLRMHLRTYLSSRHHPEAWVKGGYLQIDKLDFIREGFAQDLMNHLRIKIGHMENNYGDAHFRRTDNAMALYNPFVGNYLMDSFTTEVGAEVYYFNKGWMGMLGATNGKLNQSVTNPDRTSPSLLAKAGYDKYVTQDLRLRLTGSVYHTNQSATVYLYSADRAGSRYYDVMQGPEGGEDFRSGRINPELTNEITAFMFNPFIKFKNLEFFGIYEVASGKQNDETEERTWNQYSGELIYRFGRNENLYVSGRYNVVEGTLVDGEGVDVQRIQLAGGWFLTRNVLAKLEYVNQEYNGYPLADIHHQGQFNGLMLEAVISF